MGTRRFAIVDLETTGAFASGNEITEVGIIVLEEGQEVARFESLVQPLQPIPFYIQQLTGISNSMVAEAPSFAELAPRIAELTKDAVFVAHNASFDYSFLRHSFAAIEQEYSRQRLCTVRYARRVVPGLRSYSLSNLCKHFGIRNQAAHRAMGDTQATTELLKRLLALDEGHVQLAKLLKGNSGEAILPLNLDRKAYDLLPDTPGVYYFLDKKGKPLYIGKAINLKKRVSSHFSGNAKGARDQAFKQEIYDIRFEACGSELMAYLLEDHEIRHYWPPYNRAQKHPLKKYAIYAYADQRGIYHLGIKAGAKPIGALRSFRQFFAARLWLLRAVKEHGLNPAYCQVPGILVEQDVPNDEAHNEGIRALRREAEQATGSYVIWQEGRSAAEQGFVLMQDMQYLGTGYLPVGQQRESLGDLMPYLNRRTQSGTSIAIIESFLSKGQAELELLDSSGEKVDTADDQLALFSWA